MRGSMAGSGPGHLFQTRARRTLARTGSMARLPTNKVAQLPKSRTAGVGITHRSLSGTLHDNSGHPGRVGPADHPASGQRPGSP